MGKNRWNLLVDVVSLVAFLLMASTGLLLSWVLPAGSGRPDVTGCLPEREVLAVWGWTRHEWGKVHLWTSYAFLGVLALHLGLHWRWLKVTLTRQVAVADSGRRFLMGAAAAGVLFLAVLPWLGRPQPISRAQAASPTGQQLYTRECQNCHGPPEKLARLPADLTQATQKLREARPESSHRRLREMSESELRVLAEFLLTKAR